MKIGKKQRVVSWLLVCILVVSVIAPGLISENRVVHQVFAAEGMTVLDNFPSHIALYDLTGNTEITPSNHTYEVKENTSYLFDITFSETENDTNRQIASSPDEDGTGHTLTYNLPAGISFKDNYEGTAVINIESLGNDSRYDLINCKYQVSGTTLTFTWDYDNNGNRTKEQVEDDLAHSSTTYFTVCVEGEVGSNPTTVNFGNGQTIDLTFNSERELSIDKSAAAYNPYTGTIDYTVKVTSKGDNTGVTINDVIDDADNGMSLVDGSIKVQLTKQNGTVSDITSTTDVNISYLDSKSYKTVIDRLRDGETATITYSVKLDPEKFPAVASDGTDIIRKTSDNVNDNSSITYNEASVTSTESSNSPTKKMNIDSSFQYPQIKKTVSPTSIDTVEGGDYEVTWTVVLHNYHDINSAGKVIKDTFGSNKDRMTMVDGSFHVERRIYTWEGTYSQEDTNSRNTDYQDGTYTYDSGTKVWTYKIPDSEVPPEGKEYEYIITYKTKLNADGLDQKIDLNNTAEAELFGNSTATVGIGPMNPHINKSVDASDYETVDWVVTIDIPETGVTSAAGDVYLEDEFPSYDIYDYDTWQMTTLYRDNIVDSVSDIQVAYYPQKVDGEAYTAELTDKGFKITFTQENGTKSGFAPYTGGNRQIVVTYRTKNNPDWLEAAENDSSIPIVHTNKATLYVNTAAYPDSAEVSPLEQTMEKKYDGQKDFVWERYSLDTSALWPQYVSQGKESLPAFQYEIGFVNLTDDCFDTNGELLVTDTFNGDYLKLCEMADNTVADYSHDYTEYNLKDSHLLIAYSNTADDEWPTSAETYVEADTSVSGTVIFHLKKNQLPKDGTKYYKYYRFIYYLQVKDEVALRALATEASKADNNTIELTNSAVANGFTMSSVVTPYTYNLLDKTNTAWGDDVKETVFTLTINPEGIDLDPNSDYLQLIDTYDKISIDYLSISADPDEDVSWDASGNRIIFTIPDAKAITITYKAYIVGAGEVTYSNFAELKGVRSGEEKTLNFNSSGSGGASSVAINLLKYTGGNMRDIIPGVTFMLYDGNTNQKLKEYITDANGRAIIAANIDIDGFSLQRDYSYYLVEKNAPAGYQANTTKYWFKIASNDDHANLYDHGTWVYRNNDILTVRNEKMELSIPVQKIWQGTPAAKAEFELYIVSNTGVLKKAETVSGTEVPTLTLTSANDWKGTFTSIPRYDENGTMITYKVVEVNIPDGYSSDGGVRIDDSSEARIDKGIVFTNTEIDDSNLQFDKAGLCNETCALNGNATIPLQGVVFGVYAASDPDILLAKATSNSDGKVVFPDLAPGKYLIRELETIDDYKLDTNTYYATVTENTFTGLTLADGSAVPDNTLINDKYRADINLLKVNESNTSERLAKSRYGLYKKNASGADTMIASTVTDDDGRLVFEGVLTGIDYTIKELEAPDGYYVSKNPITLKFKVNENGKVVMDTAAIDTGNGTIFVSQDGSITWLEPQVTARFLKVDADGKALGGAKLHIEDADGNQVADWISSSEAYELSGILNCGQSYRLVEDQAPKGYQLADPITFRIPEEMGPDEGYVVTVSMTDEKEDITTTAITTTEVSTASTTEVSTASTTDVTTATTSTSVNTGDSASLVLALILLLASAGGLLCIDLFRHRSSK